MKESQAVQTASNGSSCRQCGTTLPERPSAKQHHFCNPKCRAAWHRAERQRRLDEALRRTIVLHHSALALADQTLAYELATIAADLVAAGAEPS